MRPTVFCYPDEKVVKTWGMIPKTCSRARDRMFREAFISRCHNLWQPEQTTTLCNFDDTLWWSKRRLSRILCPEVLPTFDVQDSFTSTARRRCCHCACLMAFLNAFANPEGFPRKVFLSNRPSPIQSKGVLVDCSKAIFFHLFDFVLTVSAWKKGQSGTILLRAYLSQ